MPFTDPKVHSQRTRLTLAQINAGVTLVPAIADRKLRVVGCRMIAYGGAIGAVTTIDILGTQGGSGVKLVTFAQASLTQSTELSAGGAGTTVLADGASRTPCDVGTGITLGKTGSNATTATT